MITLPTAFLVGPVAPGEAGDPPVARQLRALGYDVVDAAPLDDLTAAAEHAPPGRVALVDRRFVGHLHALRLVLDDTRPDVSAGPGAVAVGGSTRAQLVDTLAVLPADKGPDLGRLADTLAGQVRVSRVDVAPLVAGLADTQAERQALQARMDSVREERVRLKRAVKSDDTAFTTFVVRSYSGYAARWLARLRVSPNQITLLSLLVALGAAALCATGDRMGYVLGAVLFHVSFALDCIDGDLARYAVRYSRVGSWLDATFDRVKEYALFAGLAIGAMQTGDDGNVWWLAAAAMAFQTVRHQMHFAYEEVTAGPGTPPPLAAEVQARISGARWKVWLRRAALLPQGERSALVCLLVAFTTPRVVFVVLLATGLFAASYGFLGRFLRSLRRLHRGWSKRAAQSMGAMVDVGPIGWVVHHALPGRSLPAPITTLVAFIVLVGVLAVTPVVGESWLVVGAAWYVLLVGFASRQPLNGWADWVLPPTFRAAEYAVAITAAAIVEPDALPAAFGYVAACVFHHYDTVYRLRGAGTPPPRWLVIATGGHDGRLLLIAVLAFLGATALQVGLVVLAIGLAAAFGTETVLNTVAWAHTETGPHEEIRASDGSEDGP